MIDFAAIPAVQRIPLNTKFCTTADVLRLDLVHPVISGNKWYKLKHYIEVARQQEKNTLLTFGGAYSNHIVATAAAAEMAGFRSIGIIRGERPAQLSPSLQQAASNHMQLIFSSREDYRLKKIPDTLNLRPHDYFCIAEGGYGALGAQGVADIIMPLQEKYSHILCAVGTGTTLAGIVKSGSAAAIGISSLKNNTQLHNAVNDLLSTDMKNKFSILHQYHFGGYARHTPELIMFMNDWYRQTGIPTDFVYTGKLFFAFTDLLKQGHFSKSDRVLIVHSGGLQGNRSLSKGTLIF